MVALGALSYLLRLDGQKSLADHYDQTNHNFITYFLGYAKVSDFSLMSLILLNLSHYVYYTSNNACRMQRTTTTIYSMTYLTQHGH